MRTEAFSSSPTQSSSGATGKFCGAHPSVLDCANGHQKENKENKENEENEEQAERIKEADKAKACCQR